MQRIRTLSTLALVGILATACVTGSPRDTLDLHDADAVTYDDRTGVVGELPPPDRGPELDYQVLSKDTLILVTTLRDARDELDHGDPVPQPEEGLHRVEMSADDLAFFLDAEARWVDHEAHTLLADDGEEIGEWPID